jgi:hypothetical protein
MPPPPPKPRPIRLESHILAYFGDYMNLFEESVKRTLKQQTNVATWPNTHYNGELSPAALKYIASSRSHS